MSHDEIETLLKRAIRLEAFAHRHLSTNALNEAFELLEIAIAIDQSRLS